MNTKNIIDTLVAAVECSQALDIKHSDGRLILEKHGFDYDNRFDLPATEFVKQKQNEAMKLVEENNA